MKKVFIETNKVQQLRRAVQQAEDTEKGRPGMVAVWGEAGSGKTEAARMLYAEKGVYLRAMEGIKGYGPLIAPAELLPTGVTGP